MSVDERLYAKKRLDAFISSPPEFPVTEFALALCDYSLEQWLIKVGGQEAKGYYDKLISMGYRPDSRQQY